MKRFLTLLMLMPTSAFAHGAHPPVPDMAHGVSHVGPALSILLIIIAGGLALRQRSRS